MHENACIQSITDALFRCAIIGFAFCLTAAADLQAGEQPSCAVDHIVQNNPDPCDPPPDDEGGE